MHHLKELMEARNLFLTQTGKGVLAGYAALLITLIPMASGIVERRLSPDQVQDYRDTVQIVLAILGFVTGTAGAGLALKGRYEATPDIYTPAGLPGRNKEDLIQ